MEFARTFEDDAVVNVYIGDTHYLGLMKWYDSDEIWIECLQAGAGWKMARVLIQRKGATKFVIAEVPGEKGLEDYAHRVAMFPPWNEENQGERLGAVALLHNQKCLLDIVLHSRRTMQETHHGKLAVLLAAIERLTDQDCLRQILEDKGLDNRLVPALQAKIRPVLKGGPPYRSPP